MRWPVLAWCALAVAIALAGCGDNLPAECQAPSATARLDVETCVDHQDVAICRWADPEITTPGHVFGCAAPSGVECAEDCPPNHYQESP